MAKLRKIDAETNVITWFEIPVLDTSRAKIFHENILDIEMKTLFVEETAEELTFFPFDPSVIQATSGRVTGVLTKSKNARPAADGTKVYLNAYPEIDLVINRVEKAGGKIITPKMQIKAGFIAVIEDTEGNHVGLHAER